MTNTNIYPANVFDRAMAQATPVYPAASDGTWPEVPVGSHCYLLGNNGLFVMGRNAGFNATIRVAELEHPTPFGAVEEAIRFDRGAVPVQLIRDAAHHAIATSPVEWAGALIWDETVQGYRLQHIEADAASPTRITYRRETYDDDALVVDMHSHGEGNARFSPTDDTSDAEGVYIAALFGRCEDTKCLQSVARLTINGHFRSLILADWTTTACSEQPEHAHE